MKMLKKHCNIDLLPHEHHFQGKMGISLIKALAENNIFLRSDCGGKGVCNKCLVEIADAERGGFLQTKACAHILKSNISIRIPASSLMHAHIVDKAPVALPLSFRQHFSTKQADTMEAGIAVDLGTTTIAVYLCNMQQGKVISSVAVKNPQSLYGDDVMSRISEIGESPEKLTSMQHLVIRAIEWGTKELCKNARMEWSTLRKMVIVGNPTMIHILLGESPASLGTAPYLPRFFEAKTSNARDLGMDFPGLQVETLPQVAGFIGGDAISAVMATELEDQPVGTLLIDLGTNGELVLKGHAGLFATSCATGPAFEGATLSSGMQATPGAIDRISLANRTNYPAYSVIQKNKSDDTAALGICGSGIISGVASLLRTEIIEKNGRFSTDKSILPLQGSGGKNRRFIVVPGSGTPPGNEVAISQKDIRSIQLGKAALITGIEFLLRAAEVKQPEKVIVAGAFGTYLNKDDILILGMVPSVDPIMINMVGNAAGSGAIMALCDHQYLEKVKQLAERISVIDLAVNIDFQNTFIQRLAFP